MTPRGRQVAKSCGYSVAKIKSWLGGRIKSDTWANARSMRTLLERAMEAQAVRLSKDPTADLKVLTTADIEAAIASQR